MACTTLAPPLHLGCAPGGAARPVVAVRPAARSQVTRAPRILFATVATLQEGGMPRIRRWFSWKVWDQQSAAVVLEKQERQHQAHQAQQHSAQAYHQWQVSLIPHFLRQAADVAGIGPETPHADAWAEYLRWCEHFNYRPVSEREFAQERNLYR
jgi:hypothetical protein